jgi:hypothetical protein
MSNQQKSAPGGTWEEAAATPKTALMTLQRGGNIQDLEHLKRKKTNGFSKTIRWTHNMWPSERKMTLLVYM